MRRHRPTLVLAALYIAAAVAAMFAPLAGEFHYEFSAIMALVASLLGGIGTLFTQTRIAVAGTEPAGGELTHSEITGRQRTSARIILSTGLSLLPILPPLLIAPFSHPCGLLDGLAWYALLVPASAAISAVLALLAERLARRRRRLALLIFLILWSVSLLRGAYEGYTGPHIFLYAWQIGFFPGGSWDTELAIPSLLLLYRAATLVAAMGLLAVVRAIDCAERFPDCLRARKLVLPLMALAVIVPLWLGHRYDIGLARSNHWVQRWLGDSIVTRHATIYYRAEDADSMTTFSATNLTGFYIDEHAQLLGIPDARIPQLSVYLYSSAADQKFAVGSGSIAYTKPWQQALHIKFSGLGHTLRHELAHLMLAQFGNPLGISVSQGLLEGSAMALENNGGWRTLHEQAKAITTFGLAPPAHQLMGIGGFASYSPSLSYTMAGSFSRFLIDRYGIEAFKMAYPWGDFESAYGKSASELAEVYRRFLDSLPPPPPNEKSIVQAHFAGGSFFDRKCLRRIGTLNGKGERALDAEHYSKALALFGESLEHGTSATARSGVIRSLWGMANWRGLIDSMNVYTGDDSLAASLIHQVELGDAYWGLGNRARALEHYNRIIIVDPSRSLTLRTVLRSWFLHSADTTLRRTMRSYFTHSMSVLQRVTLLDQAWHNTTDPDYRLILVLMRSSFTVNATPRQTLMFLEPVIARQLLRLRTQAPRTHTFSKNRVFILRELIEGFRDAELYTSLLDTTLVQRPRPSDLLPLLIDTPLAWPSTNYIRRRESERRRYEKWVRAH